MTQSLTLELHTDEPAPVPLAGLHRSMGLWNITRERQHHGDGVLRCRTRIPLRYVLNDNAFSGGGIEIDIVNPDAGSHHEGQGLRGLEQFGIHLRGTSDDKRIGRANGLQLLRNRKPRPMINLQVRAAGEKLKRILTDLICDE